MVECFLQDPNNYFSGIKFTNIKSTDGKEFQYELMQNVSKTYGTVINNLIKMQGRTTIKTCWDLDWKVRQIVVLSDGERYKIQNIEVLQQEASSQVNYITKNPNIDYVLSLVRIANPMEIGK